MRKLFLFFIFLFSFASSFAQHAWNVNKEKVPDEPVNEFQFLAYFFNQAVTSNFYASNDLLKGQVVGRLFSANTTKTGQNSIYFEQRLIPFFIYQPKLLDGNALLRASFEIDWTWGDRSYGVSGNFGSAFSADQVNIQTQNVELELKPWNRWTLNLGLQRLFDTPYNPYRTFVSTMTSTGYRLMYWGSDAVGASLRFDQDFYRMKAGYYQLYENNVNQNDDVTLSELMIEKDITPSWRQGLSLWYVYDRANGEGGVSILGEGLNSLLNDYNGTFRFDLKGNRYRADIFWLGTWGNYNPEFSMGRWSLNGFAVVNFGTVKTKQQEGYKKVASIKGLGANLRTGYKYGQTPDDAVTLDMFFASGDNNNISDGKYTGVITGNTWGSPGAINISSGAYILYPHGNVVNRFISAVSDLSNIGYGQLGGTLNFSKSFIPHKLSAKIGFAAAKSMFAPDSGGTYIGTELNAKISYQPATFMNIELHGAYMWLGPFYDSKVVNGKDAKRPVNPFTIFAVFKWLMF